MGSRKFDIRRKKRRRFSIVEVLLLAVLHAASANGVSQELPDEPESMEPSTIDDSVAAEGYFGFSAAFENDTPPAHANRPREARALTRNSPRSASRTTANPSVAHETHKFFSSRPHEERPWSLTNLWDHVDSSGDVSNSLVDHGWLISGSTVQSLTLNPSGPSDRFNGPTTWTDRANEYQLNQQWITVERATQTSDEKVDLGGRVDFLYGTNYRWQTSAGFEDVWSGNTSHSFYGIALPQAYLETAYADVKIKWGHFVSPVGYFTVDTTHNFFSTLPYTYQYGEPFTHWGALSTWTVSESLALSSGITRGWDNLTGAGSGSPGIGWLGGTKYAFANQASLTWVGMISNEFNNVRNPEPNHTLRYLQSLVYNLPISERWRFIVQSDFGTQVNTFDSSGTRPIGTARWYGLNNYLFYRQSDCVSWGANFEWFRDEGGFRVGSVLPTLSDPTSETRGLPSDTYGYIGNFFQATFGPRITPTPHLLFRPNVRCDWFDGIAANNGNLQPFNDGASRHQFILGLDVGVLY